MRMNVFRYTLALACSLLFQIQAFGSERSVVVIGTIHGDHNRFPLFNLETLRIVINHISPDLIIIEEDPKTFSEKWYETMPEEEYGSKRPIEIKKVLMPYVIKNKIQVIPVDDREEYDKNNKLLDSEMAKKLDSPDKIKTVETLLKSYESLFMDNYLTKTIYDFQSDSAMAILEQYQDLSRQNQITKPSQELSDKRQEKIDQNIIKALKNEKYKKALIVYGVTHRPAIVKAILKSNVAELLTLENAMKPKVDPYFKRNKSIMLGK